MKIKIGICTIILLLLLTSCAGAAAQPTATPVDIGAIQTAAVQTAFDSITQTAGASTPTTEPTVTITPTITLTTTPTLVLVDGVTVTPTEVNCDQMEFVSDSTVPDNTEMTPGQEFTKTWKVKNTAPCGKWTTSYVIIWGWGDNKMNGENTALTAEVLPGAEAEISINLKAPAQVGTYHGYWRLANNNNVAFGSTLSVVIVVK